MRLYPPYVEGTIPAFYPEKGASKIILEVPFLLNKAVSREEVTGLALKMKTTSNKLVTTVVQTDPSQFKITSTNSYVRFELDPSDLINVGQFYKIQIAFLQDADYGYYSNIAVVKCTSKPTVYIAGLEGATLGKTNNHQYNYIGTFLHEKSDINETIDPSEKLYSSRFIIRTTKGQVIADSGEILHNTAKDTSANLAHESFAYNKDLDFNQLYTIQYIATTINGLTVSTPSYRICQRKTVRPEINAQIKVSCNEDDAYLLVSLEALNDPATGRPMLANGRFVLSRMGSNNKGVWDRLFEFNLYNEVPTRDLFKDFTVEQGVYYTYSIQQQNGESFSVSTIISDRLTAPPFQAVFYDTYLSDGERQLKLGFNANVSSYKATLSENKTETIGSKYPFIFKNGQMYYHEFQIAGLLSYWLDPSHLFFSEDKALSAWDQTVNPTPENYAAERYFKQEVLSWLNNGKPKLYRSPGEGNYIVTIMGASMSPEGGLSRLLHNVSCSAYEIADYTFNNLLSHNLVQMPSQNDSVVQYNSLVLCGHSLSFDEFLSALATYINAEIDISISADHYLRIINMAPELKKLFIQEDVGTFILDAGKASLSIDDLLALRNRITITGNSDTIPVNGNTLMYSIKIEGAEPGLKFIIDNDEFVINSTGNFEIQSEEGIAALYIVGRPSRGVVTYSYLNKSAQAFSSIAEIELFDVPCKQIIGMPSRLKLNDYGVTYTEKNLIGVLEDCKRDITYIGSLKILPRPIQNIFQRGTEYFQDPDCLEPMTAWEPLKVYAVCNPREDYTYSSLLFEKYAIDAALRDGVYLTQDGVQVPIFTGKYLDGRNRYVMLYDTSLEVNGEKINFIKGYELNNCTRNDITSIYYGMGLYCEISYQYSEKTYSSELERAGKSKSLYDVYQVQINALQGYRKKMETATEIPSNFDSNVREYEIKINQHYENLVRNLQLTKGENAK